MLILEFFFLNAMKKRQLKKCKNFFFLSTAANISQYNADLKS